MYLEERRKAMRSKSKRLIGTMRWVMVGATLACLVGAGEVRAQVLLPVEQRRAEEATEWRVNDLRARARCYEAHAAARQQIWAGYSAFATNGFAPVATKARDDQLLEADLWLRECLGQLEAGVLRQTCLNLARTDAQRARCSD